MYKIETEKQFLEAVNIVDFYWDNDNMSAEQEKAFDAVLDAIEEYEKSYNVEAEIKTIADHYCAQQNQSLTANN